MKLHNLIRISEPIFFFLAVWRKLSYTPCFWMETLVRCTNMLSSSLILALYFTVQNLANPKRNLKIYTTLECIFGNVTCEHNTMHEKVERYLQVALQRSEGGHQNIESKVKFLSTNQKRVVNIFRDDISILRSWWSKAERNLKVMGQKLSIFLS